MLCRVLDTHRYNMKSIRVSIPDIIYNRVKNKCNFHDYTIQEIVVALLTRFIEGDFDKDFKIDETFRG